MYLCLSVSVCKHNVFLCVQACICLCAQTNTLGQCEQRSDAIIFPNPLASARIREPARPGVGSLLLSLEPPTMRHSSKGRLPIHKHRSIVYLWESKSQLGWTPVPCHRHDVEDNSYCMSREPVQIWLKSMNRPGWKCAGVSQPSVATSKRVTLMERVGDSLMDHLEVLWSSILSHILRSADFFVKEKSGQRQRQRWKSWWKYLKRISTDKEVLRWNQV